MRVVIPAAGRGTRFLPATRVIPKEMLPVVSKPVIEYVVEEAIASGADDILIITGYAKRAIEDYFAQNSHDVGIHFIRQDEPKGLGDAILRARWHVSRERFGVLLGDTIHEATVPVLSQLHDRARALGGCVVAVETVPDLKVSQYGIIEGRPVAPDTWQCTNIIEKPAPTDTESRLAITGAYLLTRDIFDALHALHPGAKGEIQLTDALGVLAREQAVYAVKFEGVRYDIGDPAGWLQANLEFAHRDPALREKLKGAVEKWQKSS
jgi:UTP--glucose-1-phosphate uridylyltransferase